MTASPVSWPSSMCSASAGAAAFMILRTSYTMGLAADDKGEARYLQAFWSLMVALVLVSVTVGIIKFVE